MAYDYIGYASPAGDPPYGYLVNDTKDSVISHLNNHLDSKDIDFNFYSFEAGNIPIDAANYGEGDDDEEAFAQDCLEYLNQNDELLEGDIVLIPHGKIDWGYGRRFTYTTPSDGTTAKACLVFAGGTAVDWEVEAFTYHEIGHAIGASHVDGNYNTYYSNGEVLMHEVSPMGTSYTYDRGGTVDTRFPGGDDPPESLCYQSNYVNDWGANNKRDLHKWSEFSGCALDEIEDWAESKT